MITASIQKGDRCRPRAGLASGAALLLLAALSGAAFGILGYTFLYARGASYLTDDPSACSNCHVMRGHYDAWLKSSHRAVATCNDCHTPAGIAGKYAVKTENGWRHSYAFTTGRFPDPILIVPRDRAVVEGTCRKCHADVVEAMNAAAGATGPASCVRCHDSVGHLH